MVVVYKLAWPTYVIARALIRVPYIAMVNLLAGRALVPELIQNEATVPAIAQAAKSLIENPGRLQRLRTDLIALREKLGSAGTSDRAARELLREIQKTSYNQP